MRRLLAVGSIAVVVISLFTVFIVGGGSAEARACRWHRHHHCNPRPTPTPTVTTPSPSPSATVPTPSPTPTKWDCTAQLGGSCGAYAYSGIPNSNGYNTYVSNQAVGPNTGTTETIYANNPGDWMMVADALPYGATNVQTFPDVQQLFNNWCGTTWNGCASPTDTPLNSLRTLKVNYTEESPTGANDSYEYAADLWLDNYTSDIMFWVDTKGRCDEGAFGGTVLGNATFGGRDWTVHRYGDAGAEIIFVLNGNENGPCARDNTGTIDIKAGVDWLVSHGIVSNAPVMSQLNTGWEVTSAEHATFRVTQYSIDAT